MEQSSQWLNRVPSGVVIWTWHIARILICAIVYFIFSITSLPNVSPLTLQIIFYAWLGWAFATTLMAIGAQPLQHRLLRTVIMGDTILTFATVGFLRGLEGAVIAFAICITVIAMSVRMQSRWVLGACCVGISIFLVRDLSFLIDGKPTPFVPIPSEMSEILHGILLGLVGFMLFIWGSRRYSLESFDSAFSSIRTLTFENSFEFDLQAWTNACAALFAPQKAAFLLNSPAQNSANQIYHCNLPLPRDEDRENLVGAIRNLPAGCSIFDTEFNRIASTDTGEYRSLDDNEQRIARLLHRANIKAALVQPMQIDRARGGFICAINGPIDAIVIAEAAFIGEHVAAMAEYLGNVARAQRNFIADAHDVARRDLHDGVLQSLAALRMRLLLLTKRDDIAKRPVELEIRKAVDIVTLEQSRLRGFLEKSETADHTVNLVSQIDICVRTISLQWGIDVKLKSEEPAIPVDTESSFNIEHLLREVITNAVRHAKSKSLTVTLSLKQDALMMAVTDLTQPLEGAQVIEKSALTMKSASLRDRLRLVNGEAYAEGLGKGTLLSIRIPMQQIEND